MSIFGLESFSPTEVCFFLFLVLICFVEPVFFKLLFCRPVIAKRSILLILVFFILALYLRIKITKPQMQSVSRLEQGLHQLNQVIPPIGA